MAKKLLKAGFDRIMGLACIEKPLYKGAIDKMNNMRPSGGAVALHHNDDTLDTDGFFARQEKWRQPDDEAYSCSR